MNLSLMVSVTVHQPSRMACVVLLKIDYISDYFPVPWGGLLTECPKRLSGQHFRRPVQVGRRHRRLLSSTLGWFADRVSQALIGAALQETSTGSVTRAGFGRSKAPGGWAGWTFGWAKTSFGSSSLLGFIATFTTECLIPIILAPTTTGGTGGLNNGSVIGNPCVHDSSSDGDIASGDNLLTGEDLSGELLSGELLSGELLLSRE